jgi:hypothetical protein
MRRLCFDVRAEARILQQTHRNGYAFRREAALKLSFVASR